MDGNARGERGREVRVLRRPLGAGELFIIAGPCVLVGSDMALAIGGRVREAAAKLGVRLIFKAS